MGKVIADQSVSLDGFNAGPNVGMETGCATAASGSAGRASTPDLGGPDAARSSSPWQEVTFEQADNAMRAAEPVDRSVQRIVGQHHAERAQRQAIAP
jgi:hypothetical protein